MKFTKMQAFGNDYVYIDAIHQHLDNLPELARFVSDLSVRKRGFPDADV